MLPNDHRDVSHENTPHTIINLKIIIPNKSTHNVCSYVSFSSGLKNEFETAVVNEPLVFEPLKFYLNKSNGKNIEVQP